MKKDRTERHCSPLLAAALDTAEIAIHPPVVSDRWKHFWSWLDQRVARQTLAATQEMWMDTNETAKRELIDAELSLER